MSGSHLYGINLVAWKKTSATTWESRETRGYTATITFNDLADPKYTLATAPAAGIDPGYDTLYKAKNALRKFLLTVPVVV